MLTAGRKARRYNLRSNIKNLPDNRNPQAHYNHNADLQGQGAFYHVRHRIVAGAVSKLGYRIQGQKITVGNTEAEGEHDERRGSACSRSQGNKRHCHKG